MTFFKIVRMAMRAESLFGVSRQQCCELKGEVGSETALSTVDQTSIRGLDTA